MKKLLALLAALLLLAAPAAADEPEMILRALCCMDKTGTVEDLAARAALICGADLKENEGVWSGKVRLANAVYTLIVQAGERGGMAVSLDVRDTASRWSTNGAIAKKFDKVMTGLFEAPWVDALRDENDEAYDKPAPRITTGPLNLKKTGELRKQLLVIWQNRARSIFATLTGQRDYRTCAFRMTLQFGGEPPEALTAAILKSEEEGDRGRPGAPHGEEDEESDDSDAWDEGDEADDSDGPEDDGAEPDDYEEPEPDGFEEPDEPDEEEEPDGFDEPEEDWDEETDGFEDELDDADMTEA